MNYHRIWADDGFYVTKVLDYRKNEEVMPYQTVEWEISTKLSQENTLKNTKAIMEKWTKELNTKYKKKALSFQNNRHSLIIT